MARIKRLFAVGVVASLVAVAVPSQAQARVCVLHGSDYACVSDDRTSITVCDRERDGHHVRAQYYLDYDPARHFGPWDRNGADSPCYRRWRTGINWFRLCEVRSGCSWWARV